MELKKMYSYIIKRVLLTYTYIFQKPYLWEKEQMENLIFTNIFHQFLLTNLNQKQWNYSLLLIKVTNRFREFSKCIHIHYEYTYKLQVL